MKIASIDMGSNTVLLLIAQIENKKLLPIINRYFSPRLGKDLSIGGRISESSMNKLFEVLEHYKELIEEYDCRKVIISATNAMRIASNSQDIITLVKEKYNMDIEIISGDEEARLSYLGASSTLPNLTKKMVIDIGGGSTEIIYGENDKILFKNSFQTGVVSLTERFLNKFPYSKDSLEEANLFLNDIFSVINEVVPKNTPTIAVAGTPTTLSCINQNLRVYDENKVERSQISKNELTKMLNRLKQLSGDQIKSNFGEVVEGREDVLFAGTLILNHITNELLIDRIIVSSRGLRYGNIINYLNIPK